VKPKPLNVPLTLVALTILVALYLSLVLRTEPHATLSGQVWGGIPWEVKISNANMTANQRVRTKSQVISLLREIDQSMSTYRPDSEISLFNLRQSTEAFELSPLFTDCLALALSIAHATDGKFDPTVGPLVNLWGFGPPGRPPSTPPDEMLTLVRDRIGYQKLALTGNTLRKLHPATELNLSAIAKGFGVDHVFRALTAHGFKDLYVNIGGEVRIAGVNFSGIPWLIGIESPALENASSPGAVLARMQPGERAVAGSGNYRNFYRDADGRWISHIIDPVSGQTVQHESPSVTVLAPDCTTADALATALYVMGPERGLEWIKGREGLDAIFVLPAPDGRWHLEATPGVTFLPD